MKFLTFNKQYHQRVTFFLRHTNDAVPVTCVAEGVLYRYERGKRYLGQEGGDFLLRSKSRHRLRESDAEGVESLDIDWVDGEKPQNLYALTENPMIYVSFIKQFWSTATARTSDNGEVELTATIDGQEKTITEASLRRHLKLEDSGGITALPNTKIFEQLALMGVSRGYSGVEFPLFPTMITAPETSPSRITSSPSLSPKPSLSP
ncbi:hypothetical protein Tco_0337499 [Tanacetum coccineum]